VPDDTVGRSFKRWFWRPPRAHGETIAGRTVSFLELFYDLVYVAVITQAAHHIAEHVSTRGFVEFTVVFGLVWVAWVNGSLYLELHGREDGRTRAVVFIQMGVLTLLAVFAADAADGSGREFALVYATFLAVMTWLWYSVWRQDRHDHREFLTVAGLYVSGMVVAVVVILVSAFLPTGPRLVVWAFFSVGWIVGIGLAARSVAGINAGLSPSESLVERLGLFTILVLGCHLRCRRRVLLGGSEREDDHHRNDRAGHGLRILVDLLRPGRPAPPEGRGSGTRQLAAQSSADHAGDHRGRRSDGQPHQPCP
jgi:low temperature requirement protein LtrA